jgi:hypothetical protein
MPYDPQGLTGPDDDDDDDDDNYNSYLIKSHVIIQICDVSQ